MPVEIVDGVAYVEKARLLVERLLDRYLPSADSPPEQLHEAMRYSVLAGGKRLRPILCLAAYDYCKGDPERAEATVHRAMAALEIIHTYSLIHDDLPCMDDDDLRRGRPTCHKKYSEAIAVLAGDALHVVAFELMAQTGNLQTVLELAEAVGTSGMIGGQVADIEAEGGECNREVVTEIHTRKTGALIRGSVRIGALLAGADKATLNSLTVYGENIGFAFQIIDDLLDIEGDADLLGKTVGSDTRKQKATYPAAVGLEAARADAARHIDSALAAIDDYEGNMLAWLARYVGQRER